jgi:hypothetical protein
MKHADQVCCGRSGSECVGRGYGLVWSIVLVAIVLSGTQVSHAQHGQDSRDTSARTEKSQGVPRSHEPVTSDEERKHWSAVPGCFEQASDIPDRTESRTWTLVSPDGLYKAYAVNEAVVERSDGEISGCKSTSKLFVSGTGSNEAKVVLTIEPGAYISANSIELVDWSPHDHILLMRKGMFVWASDASEAIARTYDADSGKVSDEGLFYEAFARLLGRKCVATFDPSGFSSDGKVVVKAFPDIDYDGILQKDSCVKKTGVWGLNLGTGAVSRERDEYKVRRYGVREPKKKVNSRDERASS